MAEPASRTPPVGLVAAGGMSFGVAMLLVYVRFTGDVTSLTVTSRLTRLTVASCGAALLIHLHILVAYLLPLDSWLHSRRKHS